MVQRLTDVQVAEIRDQAAQGRSRSAIAAAFGVSRQHIGRLARREVRPAIGGLDRNLATGSVATAVERFLEGLELDAGEVVKAEAARVLAVKLDACRGADSAVAAGVAPRVAAELLDLVGELRGASRELNPLQEIRARRDARVLARAPDRFRRDS